MDNTLLQAATASIETIANKALMYDPATKKQVAAINDILCIDITAPLRVTLYIRGQDQGVAVLSYCEQPPTATLTGSTTAFATLLQNPQAFANSGITLTGSPGLLQRWQTIIAALEIDWEDAISQVLGDIAGPIASQGIKKTAQWWQSQAKEQQRLLAEYVTEELKWVPSTNEMDCLTHHIAELRLQMDRISARTERLQQAWQTLSQAHLS